MSPSPLQLYVHIPFCVHKCPYCDFNSHVRPEIPWDDYGRALVAELAHWAEQQAFQGRRIDSLFFGGGTPSLAPPGLIASVIDAAARHFPMAADAEITLEANPGTVDAGHFAAYRTAGVNRLSIGVQSFDTAELSWLERIHGGDGAVRAYDAARQAGFDNINLDLIYALPGQGLGTWMTSLGRAVDLAPEHLSCYQLTVEPHTLLASRHARTPYPLPDDETSLQFLWCTRERLAAAGFIAYEVSNFAQAGHHCRHNDGYWLYRDYIGIGAGAAGKRDMLGEIPGDIRGDADDGGVYRYTNTRSPEGYMRQVFGKGQGIGSDEHLARRTAAAEAVWMGLRRRDGLARPWFAERFGEDALAMFGAELSPWLRSDMVQADKASLRLSRDGLAQADSIAAGLF
jgi:oxygen-independent coproporphyrinogen III oxidase